VGVEWKGFPTAQEKIGQTMRKFTFVDFRTCFDQKEAARNEIEPRREAIKNNGASRTGENQRENLQQRKRNYV